MAKASKSRFRFLFSINLTRVLITSEERGISMRKVILQEFVTLDGLAAGPNNSVDFVPRSTRDDRSFGTEQVELMDTIDTILLGRLTYSMFAGYWPNVTAGEEKPFADKLNSKSKIVFSQTLDTAPWGKWDSAMIVRRSAVDQVAELKQVCLYRLRREAHSF
jgi:dihydrofolate reductase